MIRDTLASTLASSYCADTQSAATVPFIIIEAGQSAAGLSSSPVTSTRKKGTSSIPTMAPSEEFILGNFLLSPAPLPTVMSLQKFTELFPKRLRSHPHIRALYRELQQVREHDMDRVSANIDQQLKQGELQRAELRKASMARGVEDLTGDEQREMDVDFHLFGQAAHSVPEDYHSVASLLAEMETACANIEHEIADVDQEAERILTELKSTVGDMSDLRYGKLPGPAGAANVVDESIKGLQHLEDACYKNRGS